MQKGYQTKSKGGILNFIEEHKEKRFSAADVHRYLTDRATNVNLTTVYRNLEKLTEAGILLRLGFGKDGSALYQYLIPENRCHEHLHIQCNLCGRVFHVDDEFMSKVNAYFKEHGYELISEESVLIGVCGDCRKEHNIESVRVD